MSDQRRLGGVAVSLAAAMSAAIGASTADADVIAHVGGSDVMVSAASGTLEFYWKQDGTSSWHPERVPGAAPVVTDSPAVAQVGNSSVIAAPGSNGTIDYYYQPIGAARWSAVQVVTNASGAPRSGYGWPSIAQVGNATVIVAQGANFSLWRFSQAIGSPT